MSNVVTILFAGGGTGGHIFPNMGILDALREEHPDVVGHFLVSKRAVDQRIVEGEHLAHTALPAAPLRMGPVGALRFVRGYYASRRMVERVIEQTGAKVMVATGGFVSGPAMAAARRCGLKTALVNLDAVPGKVNRWLAGRVSKRFTVYPEALTDSEVIGMPLRAAAKVVLAAGDARQALGLDADTPTLLITAGSLGAKTINQMMITFCRAGEAAKLLAGWQVVHLCGAGDGTTGAVALQSAYQATGIRAKVEPFCRTMGTVWAAAELAISRAGAGSVAEVWASGTPTIFMPYPYHRDDHQRMNAQPLVNAGGAVLQRDLIDPDKNAPAMGKILERLITDASARQAMRDALVRTWPADGGQAVARWICDVM